MTPEERKLMISIAKSVEEIGKKVLEIDAAKAVSATTVKEPKIVSVIEHDKDKESFRMDVKFIGMDSLAPSERMERSTHFMAEMEALLNRYKVERMSGSYINNNLIS